MPGMPPIDGSASAPARSTSAGDPPGAHRPAPQDHGEDRGEDAARLGALLRRGRDGRGREEEADGSDEDRPRHRDAGAEADVAGPGDAILAGLGIAVTPAGASAPAAANQAARAAPVDLDSLVDQVAQRVLVGQRADGETEIRVTLGAAASSSPSVLDGTDVRIALHQGALEVRIEPATAAAADLLRSGAAGLSQTLAERLHQPVTLALAPVPSDSQSGGGGQDRRRSSGYDDILRYAAGQDR